MNPTLGHAFRRLAQVRPCFHSEADFQFALGWHIKEHDPRVEVRMEVPLKVGSRTYKLDLFFRSLGRRVAVELKYFKAPLQVSVSDEEFSLIDAVAHDINRYDFLKDIQRMEHLLGAQLADEAYAIVITNQPKYWEVRPLGKRVDEQFGLEHGRNLSGSLQWADHVGGTSKGREDPILLAGNYQLDWRDYSEFRGVKFGTFRVLAVQAIPGLLPTEQPAQVRRSTSAQPRVRRRPDYEALAEYLSQQDKSQVVIAFTEVEQLTGPLPMSARRYTAWWGNHRGNPQAKWMAAGWKVESIDLASEQVELVRPK